MAIENTYLLGKNITLGCGFDLQAKAPLDSRQVVPAFAGLQALIDNNAAYEGMIVFDEETKKTYQAQMVDGALAFREFGINEAELKDLIASETTAAMEFKGAATALPENPAKGDMYKVTAAFKVGEDDVKVGDSIVYDGEQWFIIPSGDDIEDTWRPVTDVDNDATLTFADGAKLDVTVAANGTITYSHEEIDAPELLAENEQTRTYITEVETDGFGHITGYKTATENVVDTNTTYEFESQAEESSVYFNVTSSEENADPVTVYLDAYSKNEADAAFKTKQTAYSAEGSDKKTITKVTQNANGEVEVTYGDIDFSHNHDEQYKKLQDAIAAVATETNVFVDTVAQNENGEIEITTKAVDFTAVNDAIDDKLNANGWTDYVGEGWQKDASCITSTQIHLQESSSHFITLSDSGINGFYEGSRYELNRDGLSLMDSSDTSVKVDTNSITRQTNEFIGMNDNGGAIIETVTLEFAYPSISGTLATTGDITASANEISGELAKKVDKVEGKSLIDDSEIARLAALTNYDDAQVKADIAKKADAEAMATELDKKVDKVDGKDLIATSEIERLATLKNYDDTALVGRVTDAEGKITDLETEAAKHALKADVEAEFSKYTKTADLPTDLGDFTNNAGYAKTTDVNTELDKKADKTQVATDIANAVAPLATTEALNGVKATADAAAVATEVEAALALKADKSVVDAMYTNAKIDELVQGAKDYADANDADTKYGIVYDSDNKKIKLVEGGTEAEIDATAFIKDGMIESVALSEDGLNLVITWNTDSDKGENNVTTIPLSGLVDIYTGVEGARINVVVSSDNKVSAELVAGSISKNYLDDGVQASLAKADSALQTHQDISHLATTEALNGVNARFDNYTNTTDLNAALELKADKTQVAADIAAAKTEASNKDAVVLAEAQKYSNQAKADAIADAEGKVNALAEGAVAANAEDIKTLFEMFQWGSF